MSARDWDKLRRQDKARKEANPIGKLPVSERKDWVRKMALRYGPKFGAKMARKYL